MVVNCFRTSNAAHLVALSRRGGLLFSFLFNQAYNSNLILKT